MRSLEEKGQLEILGWDSTFLLDGAFNEMKMLAMIDGVLTDSRKRGFPRTRFYGSMVWAVENRLGVEDFICFEARVNDVISKHEDPVACGYDLTRSGRHSTMVWKASPAELPSSDLSLIPSVAVER